MRAVGLVVNPDRPAAADLARRVAEWCAARGIDVHVGASGGAPQPANAIEVEPDQLAKGVDLIVSLGGDGTMLHTVALVYPTDVPVLGINAGQLGYLNAFEGSELERALERIANGDYEVQP